MRGAARARSLLVEGILVDGRVLRHVASLGAVATGERTEEVRTPALGADLTGRNASR